MIRIGKPFIELKGENARCICEILVDQEKKAVWFEVDKKYAKYLCTERADAYVIGLLNWAMRNNHNIVCDVPVTEELLYQINVILIPSLVNHGKALNNIQVDANTASALAFGDAVGTGLSCGIDSFSAIYNHIHSKYSELDITHLCINNVGAFNECYSSYGEEKVREARYIAAINVAKELGIELITSNSNFAQVFPQDHHLTHTYSSCFAIYMLQKLWRTYYYASTGYDYSKFNLSKNDQKDSGYYELLSLQCFSISSLKIYSEGGEKTRLDKTKDILDWEVAQKNLHVCISKPYNCNICSKCRRTLISLDYLNALDKFKNVFDVEYYKTHRKNYYFWLVQQHRHNDVMNEPVYQGMLKRKKFRIVVMIDKLMSPLRMVKRTLFFVCGK